MRPDRIVLGEVRGAKTLDMLQAMTTGHDRSLTIIHANSPRDTLMRIETLVAMSGLEISTKAMRHYIGSAIGLILQQNRLSVGPGSWYVVRKSLVCKTILLRFKSYLQTMNPWTRIPMPFVCCLVI